MVFTDSVVHAFSAWLIIHEWEQWQLLPWRNNDLFQEPITWRLQLLYWAFAMAFSQISLLLDTPENTISRPDSHENYASLRLVSKVPMGDLIYRNFNLKMHRTVKTPWQEYITVVRSGQCAPVFSRISTCTKCWWAVGHSQNWSCSFVPESRSPSSPRCEWPS